MKKYMRTERRLTNLFIFYLAGWDRLSCVRIDGWGAETTENKANSAQLQLGISLAIVIQVGHRIPIF
jgi:hypothetical protein